MRHRTTVPTYRCLEAVIAEGVDCMGRNGTLDVGEKIENGEITAVQG